MKRHKIQIEAFHRGSLLADEVDGELPAEAALADRAHRKTPCKHYKKAQREAAPSALKLEDVMKQTRKTVFLESWGTEDPVSYTHLTLPTIYSV